MESIKSILHQSFAVIMSLLLLCSTASFTVDKHFCGGVLIDAAIFSETKKCCDKTSQDENEEGCCKDTTEIVQGQDQLKLSKTESLDFQQQVFVTSFLVTYLNTLSELPKLIIPHKDYSPPDLIKDIHVLEEVFLI